MNNRISNLQEKLKEREIDAAIISKPENWLYLTGFTGDSGCMLITNENAMIFTDFRLVEQAKQQTSVEIIEYKGDLVESLKIIIDTMSIKKIGFEDNYITYSNYQKLLKLERELVSLKGIVEGIRKVKDEIEFENLRKAVNLGDRAFKYILDAVKPGISEKEIAAELEYFMKKNGAEDLAFDTIVASGSRTSLVHAEPSNKKIEYGDLVLFDFGCKVNGYCSDMSRTIAVGNINDKQKEIYNIVLNAQQQALEFIQRGRKCSEVDKIARDYIAQNGCGENFGHALGHGVGLYIHENPRLSMFCDDELVPGNVVTVEPGIYIEGFGGVRIEDMVIIKEDGIENLTKSPKSLIII